MPGADLTKALTDARDSALEPPMDEIERTSTASILIVDDDPGTRFLMRTALEHLGFVVIEAADGIEGYQRYERHRPDLLLGEPPMDEIERTSTASILVVDDDPGTRFLMRIRAFHNHGHTRVIRVRNDQVV